LEKYYIEVTRMVCVEAQTAEEADTIALYATQYPDDLEGVHYVNYRFEQLSNYPRMDGQSNM
jgi:hypothetical protein